MRGRTTTIQANGLITVQDYEGSTPELKTLQEAVGGYIETVPFFDVYNGEPAVAYCDEEGKLRNKPVNDLATRLWSAAFGRPVPDVLVGDVIVITGDEEFMDSL